jgi:hypothetical protein
MAEARPDPHRQLWSAGSYDTHARFVSDLAAGVVDWLAPRPGERILDLGCGDGVLTATIVGQAAIAAVLQQQMQQQQQMVPTTVSQPVGEGGDGGSGLAPSGEDSAAAAAAAMSPEAVEAVLVQRLHAGAAERAAQSGDPQLMGQVRAMLDVKFREVTGEVRRLKNNMVQLYNVVTSMVTQQPGAAVAMPEMHGGGVSRVHATANGNGAAGAANQHLAGLLGAHHQRPSPADLPTPLSTHMFSAQMRQRAPGCLGLDEVGLAAGLAAGPPVGLAGGGGQPGGAQGAGAAPPDGPIMPSVSSLSQQPLLGETARWNASFNDISQTQPEVGSRACLLVRARLRVWSDCAAVLRPFPACPPRPCCSLPAQMIHVLASHLPDIAILRDLLPPAVSMSLDSSGRGNPFLALDAAQGGPWRPLPLSPPTAAMINQNAANGARLMAPNAIAAAIAARGESEGGLPGWPAALNPK